MKRVLILAVSTAFIGLTGCNSNNPPAVTENSKAGSQDPGSIIIIDVRTAEEWNNDGHAPCTVNYPLDQLETKIDSIRKFDKVEIVCRSGKRSEQAKEILLEAGFSHVENKGSWTSVNCPR